MVRGTQRSQRPSTAQASQSSQNQDGPSKTQRNGRTYGGARRRARDEDEDEEQEEQEDGDSGREGGRRAHGGGLNSEDEDGEVAMDVDGDDEDLKRKAENLVRLALFTEQKRVPLKREDISKKVLGTNTRLFGRVFQHAQYILKNTLGMELAELPSRAGLDQEFNGPNEELDETRKATGVKKKAAASGSKTYILRSTLDPSLIRAATLVDQQILNQEMADLPEDHDDDDEAAVKPSGSIISWSTCDQVEPLGILYVILALILVNGRVISDMDLRSYLKRLRLPPNAHLLLNAQSPQQTLTTDQYLHTLLRQSYLDRVQVGDSGKKRGAKVGGVKRPRTTQGDGGGNFGGEDDQTMYEWRWGSRAFAEIGEVGIAQFVADFMVGGFDDDDDSDEEEEELRSTRGGRGAGRSDGKKKKKEEADARLTKMVAGIEKIAGGHLAEIK